MRALKLVCLGMLSIVGFRYGLVYYDTYEFNGFVQRAVHETRSQALLTQIILRGAGERQLPIGDQDITLLASNSMLRVSIEYQVPMNFYVFRHALKFKSVASDFSR